MNHVDQNSRSLSRRSFVRQGALYLLGAGAGLSHVSRMLAEIESQQGRKRREGDSPQSAERISWEECKRLLQTDVAVREGGEK